MEAVDFGMRLSTVFNKTTFFVVKFSAFSAEDEVGCSRLQSKRPNRKYVFLL